MTEGEPAPPILPWVALADVLRSFWPALYSSEIFVHVLFYPPRILF